MKQITIDVYTFDKLSESAKQKAIEKNAYNSEYFWGNDAIKSLEKFAEHFNCELKNYSIDWCEKYRCEVSFNVPEYMQNISKKELKRYIMSMGKFDKKTLKGIGECKFTGVCFDEDAADGARIAFLNGETDLKEILYAGYESWIKAGISDYEYQISEAGYTEQCEANDYEFDIDGNML